MAPQELEKSASRYASDAIKQDSQGDRGMAITNYQKATESLLKLQRLYPDSQLNKIYADRMRSYQNRIRLLQSTSPTDVESSASPEEQGAGPANNTKNSFDEMVMKEKPDVRWEDVVGVDDAKNALRESIVYPSKRPDLFPLGWPRGILLYGPPVVVKQFLPPQLLMN